MSKRFSYTISATDGMARRGAIEMQRGVIQTPAFMPVGTAGTVKAMEPENVRATGADIILSNTYHLMLRPTAERIEALGGLHRLMNWHRPILTDSGGFQVMSLSKLRKLSEEGVEFSSHIDGSKIMLSPERSMEIQRMIGADIVMCFDECTPFPATHEEAKSSMELSMRWAKRSRDAFDSGVDHASKAALFGIVQGGMYQDLRHASYAALSEIGFDGYAIGGLAVGEGQEAMFEALDFTIPVMDKNKPRYLMGVGKPDDIIGAVMRGVDMFDCVMPSRSGRTGQAFTLGGPINMRNARHKDDLRPIEATCGCPACTKYSRAYISHLVRSDEILGSMLLTWHNIQFYQDLMKNIRKSIENNNLESFSNAFLDQYRSGDIPVEKGTAASS